jgi:hypothetical protein
VGISNAQYNPTVLFDNPLMNVPVQVHGGLLETLALALNERNRDNKRVKFGFSTSEDALTWTVFKYLHDSTRLMAVLRRAGLPIPDRVSRPDAMLLWGVPVPLDRVGNERGWLVRAQLEAIADKLDENAGSRTEPDVLIDLGPHGVTIIEVKHRNPTDVRASDYAGWNYYYPPDSPLAYAAAMRLSKCYELARNWRFGLELAAEPRRPSTLVYLGPGELFRGSGAKRLQPFEACLPEVGTARFQKVTWQDLVCAIEQAPDWLVRYVGSRGYTISPKAQ